ncbi:hypothetical protein HYY72_00205 [Candidatus Woesearchaeota archaeon]|nr:hypothetical protein [Candidatus Woesearchaeota archaeon]
MKGQLADRLGIILLKSGFAVKCLPRRWFDIVARRGDSILIIKVLNDANSISFELAREMSRIASLISAAPLIIAEKAGSFLDDGVVYLRFGVRTISIRTFEDCINNRLPFVTSNQSGLTASIDARRLAEEMAAQGYSLTYLSGRVGVSKQMIARYRVEKSEISIKKAHMMQRIFGDRIFERVDIFSSGEETPLEKQSVEALKYESLGFKAVDAKKAPFDIVAKKGREIIFTDVGDNPHPELESITRLIDAEKLVIFDRKKPSDRSIPNISREEFLDLDTANELIKFLREFE